MPGNNSIQILRGNNVRTNTNIRSQTLLEGQPLYDLTTGYLYVGDGEANIFGTHAVNAHYANSAGTAETSRYLLFRGTYSNGTVYNGFTTYDYWNGRANANLYVPLDAGSTGQVWGMINNTTPGWIDVPEPSSVANSNYANFAGNLTDGDKTIDGNLTITANLNVVGGCLTEYIHINGHTIQGGPQPLNITSGNDLSHISVSNASISLSSMGTGGLTIYSSNRATLQSTNGIDIFSGNDVSINSPSIDFSSMPTVNGSPIAPYTYQCALSCGTSGTPMFYIQFQSSNANFTTTNAQTLLREIANCYGYNAYFTMTGRLSDTSVTVIAGRVVDRYGGRLEVDTAPYDADIGYNADNSMHVQVLYRLNA